MTKRRRGVSVEEGVIVAHLGVAVDVDVGAERRRLRVPRRSGLVVGDAVRCEGERITPLPRRTELLRKAPGGGVHVVAANLDVLGIVVAPDPPARVGLVDRAAVAARAAGIRPFVVVNKMDLPGSEQVLEEMQRVFGRDLRVIAVSAAAGTGIEELVAHLAQSGRAALSGHSGVGKTSLANRLVPGLSLRVGELSSASGRGRHVTTVSTLHRLPTGGELVDTPGVREYGLAEVKPSDVAHYFVGISERVHAACRFRDCLHLDEPGCAVREAVASGDIDEERYLSYCALVDEVRSEAEDPR